jgi:hypothetical protein
MVFHDLLDVVHSSKMTTFEVEFEFWEKDEVTRAQIRRVWGLRNHWNNFLFETSLTKMAVMQHQIVRMPSSSVNMSWTVW